MKKYLLGITAVVVAIAFSAFITTNTNSNVKRPLTDYYFYTLNSTGTQLQAEVSSSAISLASAESTTGCNNNVNAAMCAYGFTYRITSLPADIPGDFSTSFKKSN